MTQQSDLAARIAALEDERAILDTLYAYAHAIDYGDEEGWVDCFTEDGVFDIRTRSSPELNREIAGREALAESISRHSRAPAQWHKHLLVEPRIEIDGRRAACTSYFLAVVDRSGEPVIRAFGRYRDRLVKDDDDRWRFVRRIVEAESMHPDLPPFIRDSGT